MDLGPDDERIIAHLGFARAVASRTIDRRCHGVEREDLVAWGILGLVQAARRYRAVRGVPFGTFAAHRVRGQVLDVLRACDPLTRTERRAFREARQQDPSLPPPVQQVSLERCAAAGIQLAAVVTCRTQRDRRWTGVARELRHIEPLERQVLLLSFTRGLTLREIGAEIGLSESGVSRLRARALGRVRARCA